MKLKSSGCAAAVLIAGLCWAGTAAAQTATDRAVELFTCKDSRPTQLKEAVRCLSG